MQLIECVPNFSEGRDPAVIEAITDRIAAVEGVVLLDVDSGAGTNRTVVTFLGPPAAVEEAAFRAIEQARDLIDMTRHRGEHPRMGATDVCPFVPVEGTTIADCVAVARRLGARVGSELAIPVYLYEHAAMTGRRALAEVRAGEYEGLPDRSDQPDFGPTDFNTSSGATAIGAREFLIAYNVNLNTRDRKLAHAIAQEVRELGKPVRDSAGKIVRDDTGAARFEPGRLPECKAVGWYIAEYGRAQVSLNLTNYHVTSLQAAFDACVEEAAMRGVRVTGSEIVGLVPRAALLDAGDHYLALQGGPPGVPESERVHTAVMSLGLAELAPFDPAAKVVEYRYRGTGGPLGTMTISEFSDEVSTGSPTPGGGSVAAACGALSAALASMVAALTWSKEGRDDSRSRMAEAGRRAQALKDWFVDAVDRDAAAFNEVLASSRLPRRTDAQREARRHAMGEAQLRATVVPLEVLEHSTEALELATVVAAAANPNSVSDAGVAAAAAHAAAHGASLNVRINLPGLGSDVAAALRTRHDTALARARDLAAEAARIVDAVFDAPGN